MIYLLIFISKIIENTLATLRLIVVSNGKKILGSILQGIIALIWVLSAGIVIVNINKNPIKILFFCLGSIVGSYLGSYIEEKIAIGTNMLICATNKKYELKIKEILYNYQILTISEKDKKTSILLILLKRKETIKVSKLIKKIDNECILICEKIKKAF